MVDLSHVLSQHTVVGLDTSPFIYLLEHHARYHPLVEELFGYLKSPNASGVTSVITLIEVCVQPQREGRVDLVEVYEQTLLNSQQIQMTNIDAALARRAVQLRARYGVRVPDALQVGAALEHGATLFVTNDRRLTKISDLLVLVLDDYVS